MKLLQPMAPGSLKLRSRIHGFSSGWLAAIIIVLTGVMLCTVLPRDYRTGPDEGTYFRQGSALVEHGVAAGYAHLAEAYIQTPSLHLFPNPLRVGTIAVVAVALQLHAGYQALSYVSILAFVLMLAGVWWFIARFFDRSLALATLVLMAASPLGLAMARRALMDSLATASAVASLLAFCCLLEARGRWRLPVFVASMTAALLVKETAVLLLPLYAAAMLWLWWRRTLPLRIWQIALALCAPPLLAVCAWLAAYGLDATLAMVKIVTQVASQATPYTIHYGRGPWFRYLIDYVALSPWTFVLAAAGMGAALLKPMHRWTGLLLALVVWLLVIYAPLTKNVRYLELLDFPIRLFAASMLLALLRHWLPERASTEGLSTWVRWRQPACWLPVILFGLLAVRDVAAFRHDFIVGRIYDPVTYNLLRVDNMIPNDTAPKPTREHHRWLPWLSH